MRNRILTYCLLLAALLWVCPSAGAQDPVTITGDAPFAAGEEIRLLVFDDLLNNIPSIVATDKIDKQGRFKLTYKTNKVRQVQLAIRTTKADFFVAPYNTYHFHIATDSALFGMVNPEKYGGFLHITTDKTDTADLNYKINRFTHYFDRAMNYYGFRLTYDHDKNAYDTLTYLIDSVFHVNYIPDNFYSSYVYYTCGILDRLYMVKEQQLIYDKYFNHDDVLYDNPAYMILFNSFYSNYLYNSRHISKDLLTRTINEDPDYLTLFNEAGRDPMLVSERLRELVIIRNLVDFYSNEEFDRGNIIKLLQYISVSSHFPEHVVYAENAVRLLKPSDTQSHPLYFVNEKGKKMDLHQFEGKEIYVQVFQSDCIDCIREMLLLKEYNQQYGDKLQFVSLNVDMKKDDYEQFCKTYKEMFDWPILYFNGNYDWLMANGIETLPDYMILNENACVIYRDVPAPEKGLADYLLIRFPVQEEDNTNPLFRNRQ